MIVLVIFENEVLLTIATYLLFVTLFFLLIVIYHLIKINKHISEDYENISYHVPAYNKKHYVIRGILCVLAVLLIVVIERPYIENVKEEMIYVEEKFFKVDHLDYKVPSFGYEIHRKTSLLYGEGWTSYSPLKVYLKENLLEDLDYAKYKITYNNQIIYKLEGQTTLHENRNDGFHYVEYDAFDGYKEVDIEGQNIYDMEVLKDYNASSKDLITYSIELYDDNRNLIYSSESPVKLVEPTTYHYEDEWISIENLQYDMNGIVKIPKVNIKDDGSKLTHVNIFYPHDGESEDTLLFIYYFDWDDDKTFGSSTIHRFVYDQVDEFKYLRIDYCKGETVIESRLCELEVVP